MDASNEDLGSKRVKNIKYLRLQVSLYYCGVFIDWAIEGTNYSQKGLVHVFLGFIRPLTFFFCWPPIYRAIRGRGRGDFFTHSTPLSIPTIKDLTLNLTFQKITSNPILSQNTIATTNQDQSLSTSNFIKVTTLLPHGDQHVPVIS